MNEKPASTKASSSLCEVASSAVQPNTLPPNAIGANSRPDLPSLRFSMIYSFGWITGAGLLGSGALGGIHCAVREGRVGRPGELDAELGQGLVHAPDRHALDHAGVLGLGRELEAHDQRGVLDVDQALHLERLQQLLLPLRLGHHLEPDLDRKSVV